MKIPVWSFKFLCKLLLNLNVPSWHAHFRDSFTLPSQTLITGRDSVSFEWTSSELREEKVNIDHRSKYTSRKIYNRNINSSGPKLYVLAIFKHVKIYSFLSVSNSLQFHLNGTNKDEWIIRIEWKSHNQNFWFRSNDPSLQRIGATYNWRWYSLIKSILCCSTRMDELHIHIHVFRASIFHIKRMGLFK